MAKESATTGRNGGRGGTATVTRRGPGRPPGSKTGPAKAAKGKGDEPVIIQPIKTSVMTIELEGTNSLIVHNFGAKARAQIRAKQEGRAKAKRAPKVPFDEFMGAAYLMPGAKLPKSWKKLQSWGSWPFKKDIFGFPAAGFKNAVVTCAHTFIEGVEKIHVRGGIHVISVAGAYVPIKYKKVVMREDVVRIGGMTKVADIRFRPEFQGWSIKVQVRFNSNLLTAEQVVHLFEYAGFHVGVGEWRPEKNGEYGTFAVKRG